MTKKRRNAEAPEKQPSKHTAEEIEREITPKIDWDERGIRARNSQGPEDTAESRFELPNQEFRGAGGDNGRDVLSESEYLKASTWAGKSKRYEGALRAFTVLNFDPLPLIAEVMGRRFRVEAAPAFLDARGFTVFNDSGRKIGFSFLTIREPMLYRTVTGDEQHPDLPGVWIPKTEVRSCTPLDIALEIAGTNTMPGSMVLDWDPDSEKFPDHREIWVPARKRSFGSRLAKFFRESDMDAELTALFEKQRKFIQNKNRLADAILGWDPLDAVPYVNKSLAQWIQFGYQAGYLEGDGPERMAQLRKAGCGD